MVVNCSKTMMKVILKTLIEELGPIIIKKL